MGIQDLSFDDLVPGEDKKKGIAALSFDDLVPPRKPGAGEDVAKSLAPSAIRGLTNLAGAPADLWEMLSGGMAKGAEKLFGMPGLSGIAKSEFLPTSERIRGGVENVTGPLYKPQTRPGKMVGGVVEGAASGAPFGRIPAALGAVSGAGSEVAGAITDDNPYAKMAGGLLAPIGTQAALGYRSMPGNMIRQATGDVTQQQFEQAKQLMARGKGMGVDLMAPEALPTSSIQQMASDVLASKEGGRVMNRFLANRPGQVKQATGSLLDDVAPAATPDVTMSRARQAATDVIGDAERMRTATVSPYYKAAAQDPVPSARIQAIAQSIDDALPGMSPEKQAAALAFKKDLLATNPTAGALDDLYKVTRDKVDLPAIGATPADKVMAKAVSPFKDQLDDALKASSPELKTGRQIYGQYTDEVINPLTSGPVGRVAGRQGFDPSVPQTLNPIASVANEKIARPESIRELYTQLNKQDPQAFPGMTRTWLENAFDQAAQKVQAGDNRMAGANFVKEVFGSPQQEANFLEAMKGVARANGKNPDAFAKGAKNLMEVLQSTGRVGGVGSPTGGRIATNEMASSSKLAAGMEMISTAPLSPMASKIREWAMGGNYRKLAEILTAPDAIDRIIQIGKYKPTTTTATALAIGLLEANAEGGSGR